MGCGQSQEQLQLQAPQKPHIFFLLGGPGSGKGTQAENLIRDYKFKHLSTGDLLRQEKEKGGQMAETINNYMKEGKLISSDMVVKLLKNSIQANGNRRYLFDGFPRNEENWIQFDKQLADDVVIRNLIYFDCPTEVLVERIMERAKTSGRADDNEETIKKRLNTFQTQTLPIVKKFEEKNNCIKVDASKSREQIYKDLECKLESNNVHKPQPTFLMFVLGGPGSGKGTQCDLMVKNYGFIHLSTGDLLREEVKKGSKLGKELDAIMMKGDLVSSELMVQLVKDKIARNDFRGRYLLDGFPRGQENMDVWHNIMEKQVDLKAVIYFECEQEELKRRLIHRGETSGRVDDNEQSIKKRLDVFNNQTKPVVEFYKKEGKLKSINANATIEQIQSNVQKNLDEMGVFAKK